MKLKYSVGTFMAFTAVLLFSSANLQAEESTPPAQSHEEHHPEGQAKESSKDNGMMGSMKMDDMKGMMHQCMEMHKGGKMCDHDMMQKCQKKMGKDECQKMMKQAKDQEKNSPKEMNKK